jgi:hypothetical protein
LSTSTAPIEELAGIVELAVQIGAQTVWCETGSEDARRIVEATGLRYVDAPSIVDAALAVLPGA